VANTSSRTLRLLSLLQTRRYWPGAELAGRLEVSPRTLRRDINRLRELGYPVEAQRGLDGGYQLAAGAVLPPLVLDDEEAVALGVGLQAAIQGGGVVGIEESSVRALAKIVQVMPSRLRRRVDALAAMTVAAPWNGPTPTIDPDDLTSIAQSCRDTERLEFGYIARDGARSDRRVEPYRLVLLGRRWYLVAWDMGRTDWRSFRLDRLSRPRRTGAQFVPRGLPADDAAEFVRRSIDSLPTRHNVEAVVHAAAPVVRSRIGPWATVDVIDDGRCRLRMTSESLDWVLVTLGQAGAEFDVVSPPALTEYARELIERIGRAVDRHDSEGSSVDESQTTSFGSERAR
jgi:predicted DNA-binding transcriptional regulator YafY